MKKILVIYYSQTGNTEIIARAISNKLSVSDDIAIKKVEEVNHDILSSYDCIFLGSPCHAGDIAVEMKNFIQKLPESPEYSIAGFITHAAPAYNKDDFIQCIRTLETECKNRNIPYLGSYNCQGFLNPGIHNMVKEMKGFTDSEWELKVEDMKGHPDKNDIDGAEEFADTILKSLN